MRATCSITRAAIEVRQSDIGREFVRIPVADALPRFARSHIVLQVPLGLCHDPKCRPLKAQARDLGGQQPQPTPAIPGQDCPTTVSPGTGPEPRRRRRGVAGSRLTPRRPSPWSRITASLPGASPYVIFREHIGSRLCAAHQRAPYRRSESRRSFWSEVPTGISVWMARASTADCSVNPHMRGPRCPLSAKTAAAADIFFLSFLGSAYSEAAGAPSG
jgi:hypothetical protein